MNAQMTFKRYELKYMLTRKQRDELLEAVKRCTESGDWNGYTADNLDAPEWAIEEV